MNKKLIEKLQENFADQTELSPKQVIAAGADVGMTPGEVYKELNEFPKIRRGIYDMAGVMVPFKTSQKTAPVKNIGVSSVSNDEVFVPERDKTFVEWGNFSDVFKIVKSQMFYPTFITGLSGNGKTFMVEQSMC